MVTKLIMVMIFIDMSPHITMLLPERQEQLSLNYCHGRKYEHIVKCLCVCVCVCVVKNVEQLRRTVATSRNFPSSCCLNNAGGVNTVGMGAEDEVSSLFCQSARPLWLSTCWPTHTDGEIGNIR